MANRERFPSKVVVRNLPVGLDESAFKAVIGESTLQQVDYFYYIPGKSKPKASDIPSTAFLNFTNRAALLEFNEKMDGHTFMDSRGGGISCSIEHAHSQMKPRKAGGGPGRHGPKPNPSQGSIEADEHFQQFLAEITAPAPAPSTELEPTPSRGLTPLLLAIKQKDLQKFEEKRLSRSGKKKKSNKQAKFSASANAAPSQARPATPSKRSKNKAKKKAAQNKKTGEAPGPKFGTVKIMTSSAAPSTQNAPTPSNTSASSSAPTSSAPQNPNTEPKKRQPRKPKVKKTGSGDAPAPSNAKKTAQNVS